MSDTHLFFHTFMSKRISVHHITRRAPVIQVYFILSRLLRLVVLRVCHKSARAKINYMKPIFPIIIVSILFACSQTTTEQPVADTSTSVSPDSTITPQQTVMNFLNWYKVGHPDLNANLVLNNGDGRDTTKFYRVDFAATEKYLRALTGTGMVSEKYADKWRAYFKKCDQDFIASPSNEGPPNGFDYDFVLFSQEDPGLDELQQTTLTVTNKDDNSATVLIQFPSTYHYKYSLSKNGPGWQIDEIENVNN